MKIQFFGSLGERIGREIEVEVPAGGCTVAALRQKLADAHPGAAAELARDSVRACVDETIVPESFLVTPQSEVAFFPPLSGG